MRKEGEGLQGARSGGFRELIAQRAALEFKVMMAPQTAGEQ